MDVLGMVVRLQAQRASLKTGVAPRRRYDPTPILAATALTLSEDGVEAGADDGSRIVDVHHRWHPASKNREGTNGISIGFTAHYRAMRERFGDHLADGIAGENLLIASEDIVSEKDVKRGIAIEASDGRLLQLEEIVVAAPCVEFARYALGLGDDVRSDRTVTEALQFLDEGMRGYYAVYRGAAAQVLLGARAGIPRGEPRATV